MIHYKHFLIIVKMIKRYDIRYTQACSTNINQIAQNW